MNTIAKIAAAAALALPLAGIAGAGTARADTIQFGVTIGTPQAVHYDRGHPGYGYYGGRNTYYRQQALPPRVVLRQLQGQFNNVRNLDRRGDVYVAAASDRRGRHVRVTASAYTGQIIDVDVLSRPRWRR